MERLPTWQPHHMESVEIPLEWFVIRVVFILLDGCDHRARTDETGDVIDMAIRVVTLDTVSQPKDGGHTQILAKFFFNRGAVFRGIPVGIQKATFRSDNRSLAIPIDRAAFEDEMRLLKNRDSKCCCDGGGNGVVLIEWGKFVTPGIESKIQRRYLGLLVANDKDWPVVAAPRLVGRDVKKLQTLRWAFFQKPTDCFFLLRILHIDSDDLRSRERFGHGHKGRENPLVGAGKTVASRLRPRNPSCLMGLPLGW